MTLAAATLAAPAAALAIDGGAAFGQTVPDPLGLHLSRHRLPSGASLRVTGTAPAADAGRRVVLQMARGASSEAWRQVAAGRVGKRGRFRLRFVARRSGELRALVVPAPAQRAATDVASSSTSAPPPAGSPGDGGQPLAASTVTPVVVTARLSLKRRPLAVRGAGPVRVSGRLLPAAAGRVVSLEGRTGRGWRTLARDRTGGRGGFSLRYRATREQRLRVVFPGDGANARVTAPAGRVAILEPALASWYDDGAATACGFHAGLGVANRTLPCGTHVTLSYGGRTVTAVVDDRGPYVGGRDWDLNQTTAAALGFGGVGTVWASAS